MKTKLIRLISLFLSIKLVIEPNKNKLVKTCISNFLVFSLLTSHLLLTITSCSFDSKKSLPNNTSSSQKIESKEAKSFSVKTLPTKPNDDFRIKVLKKSANVPISITGTSERPVVSELNFRAFDFKPQIRKPYFHKALTKAEIRAKRKEARKKWIAWQKERQKAYKAELKKIHKEQRLYQREVIQALLSFEIKNSPEYKAILEEQVTLRQALLSQQKAENKALRDQYKKEIADFKTLLNTVYPKGVSTNQYIPNTPSNCDMNDPNCDPFEDTVFMNELPEDQNYTYYKEDDATAYQYDNTYLDGVPYSDSFTNSDGTTYSPEVNESYFTNLATTNPTPSPSASTTTAKAAKGFKTKATSSCSVVQPQVTYDNSGSVMTVAVKDKTTCQEILSMVTEIELLDSNETTYSCMNNQKYRIETQGISSIQVAVPIQVLPRNYKITVKLVLPSGEETVVATDIQRRPASGGVSVSLIERPEGSTVQSLTESNMYQIKNTTGEHLNFKVVDSSGKEKMAGTCISMSEGTLSISKKDLKTDNYRFQFFRSSEPDKIIYDYPVEITHAKVSTFVTELPFRAALDAKFRNACPLWILDETGYYKGLADPISENESITPWLQDSNLTRNFNTDIVKDFVLTANSYPSTDNTVKKFVHELGKNINSKFSGMDFQNCSSTNPSIGAIIDLTPQYSFPAENPLKNTSASFVLVIKVVGRDSRVYHRIGITLERGYKHLVVLPFQFFNTPNGNTNILTESPNLLINANISIEIESNNSFYGDKVQSLFNPFGTLGKFDKRPYVEVYNKFTKPYLKNCQNTTTDEIGVMQKDFYDGAQDFIRFDENGRKTCQNENDCKTFSNNNPSTISSVSPGNIQPSSIPFPSSFPSTVQTPQPNEDTSFNAFTIVTTEEDKVALLNELEQDETQAIKLAKAAIPSFSVANTGDIIRDQVHFTVCNILRDKFLQRQKTISYEVGTGKKADLVIVAGICTSKTSSVTIKGNAIIKTPNNGTITVGDVDKVEPVIPSGGTDALHVNKITIPFNWYGRVKPDVQKDLSHMAGPNLALSGTYKLKANVSIKSGSNIIDVNSPRAHLERSFNVINNFPEYVNNGYFNGETEKKFIPANSSINPNIPEGTAEHIRIRHRADYLSDTQYNNILRIRLGANLQFPKFEQALNKGTCFDFGIKDSEIMSNILSVANLRDVSDYLEKNNPTGRNRNNGGVIALGKRIINGKEYTIYTVSDNNNVNPKNGYIVSAYPTIGGISESDIGGIREFYKLLPISDLINYKNNMNE